MKIDAIGSSDKEDMQSDSSSSYDEAVECRPLITRPDDLNTNETEMITRSEVEGGEGEGEGEEDEEKGEEGAEGAEEGAKEEEEAATGSKVGTMKPGDYTIHILVQNAKQLKADGDDTCDPVIEFKIGDVVGKTTKKNDISRSATVKFNEHIFLELKCPD